MGRDFAGAKGDNGDGETSTGTSASDNGILTLVEDSEDS